MAQDTGPHQFQLESWISCAPFERLLHIEIVKAADGHATLTMPFLLDFAQGAGLMHAEWTSAGGGDPFFIERCHDLRTGQWQGYIYGDKTNTAVTTPIPMQNPLPQAASLALSAPWTGDTPSERGRPAFRPSGEAPQTAPK